MSPTASPFAGIHGDEPERLVRLPSALEVVQWDPTAETGVLSWRAESLELLPRATLRMQPAAQARCVMATRGTGQPTSQEPVALPTTPPALLILP